MTGLRGWFEASAVALLVSLLPLQAVAAEVATNDFTKFKFKVGGYFEGMGHYDSNSTANRPWTNVVSGTSPRGVLSFDPYSTRTNLSVESVATDLPKAKGLLELDWAPQISPRLRLAYVQVDFTYLSILIGQYWTPYLTPGPHGYNPQWFFRMGNPYTRAPQVALLTNLGPIKVSATVTTANFLGGTVVKGNGAVGSYALGETWNPTGLLQVSYAFLDKKAYVAVTGGVGRADTAYTVAGTDARPRSGATTFYSELSFSIPISVVTVAGKLFYGQGAGMGAGVGQTLVIDASNFARAIPVLGGFLSARYSITPSWSIAAYGAIDDPQDVVAAVKLPIQRNVTFGANVTWTIVDSCILAFEFERFETTQNVAGVPSEFSDLRPSLIARYSY